MQLRRNIYYVILQPPGWLCLWSVATNRAEAWRRFERNLNKPNRAEYKKQGFRCARIEIALKEGN